MWPFWAHNIYSFIAAAPSESTKEIWDAENSAATQSNIDYLPPPLKLQVGSIDQMNAEYYNMTI